MAIYVAENGVCLSDIFIALQARVTFSGKRNDLRNGRWRWKARGRARGGAERGEHDCTGEL